MPDVNDRREMGNDALNATDPSGLGGWKPAIGRGLSDQSTVDLAVKWIKEYAEKNADLQTLLNNAKASAGGDITYKADNTLSGPASWDPINRIIRVNQGAGDIDDVVGYILFELFNAANSVEFRNLVNEAEKGEISRIDYVVLVEKMEHNKFADHSRIVKAGIEAHASGFLKWTDIYAGNAKIGFDRYLVQAIASEKHLLGYARFWSQKNSFGKKWFENHPNGNPD